MNLQKSNWVLIFLDLNDLCSPTSLLTLCRLKFVISICDRDNRAARVACIQDMKNMWTADGEFGLRVEAEADVAAAVARLCRDTFAEAAAMGFARSSGEPRETPR